MEERILFIGDVAIKMGASVSTIRKWLRLEREALEKGLENYHSRSIAHKPEGLQGTLVGK